MSRIGDSNRWIERISESVVLILIVCVHFAYNASWVLVQVGVYGDFQRSYYRRVLGFFDYFNQNLEMK